MSSVIFNVCFCLVALVVLANADDGPASGGSSSHSRMGIGGPIAGGLEPQDLNDPGNRKKYTDLAEFGLKHINSDSNSMFRQTLIRVTKVYSQVVAGAMYHITFTTGQSTCRNTKENLTASKDSCPLSNDANALYQECTVKIWVQPWRHFQKVDGFECKPATSAVLTDTS